MRRIGIVLAAILLLPVIAAGVGWVLVWLARYLAARGVVWIIARWTKHDPKPP